MIKDGKDGKDGQSPTVSVTNNGNGTHTITITNSDGKVTTTVIKDGKCGCNDKPSDSTPDKPTRENSTTPNPGAPTPGGSMTPNPGASTPGGSTIPNPGAPTPGGSMTPNPGAPTLGGSTTPNPGAPTPVNPPEISITVNEHPNGELPKTGTATDHLSILLGSGILLSLYVGKRKEEES